MPGNGRDCPRRDLGSDNGLLELIRSLGYRSLVTVLAVVSQAIVPGNV